MCSVQYVNILLTVVKIFEKFLRSRKNENGFGKLLRIGYILLDYMVVVFFTEIKYSPQENNVALKAKQYCIVFTCANIENN